MSRLKTRLVTCGLATVVVALLTTGVAEAKLANNHNETVVRDGH